LTRSLCYFSEHQFNSRRLHKGPIGARARLRKKNINAFRPEATKKLTSSAFDLLGGFGRDWFLSRRGRGFACAESSRVLAERCRGGSGRSRNYARLIFYSSNGAGGLHLLLCVHAARSRDSIIRKSKGAKWGIAGWLAGWLRAAGITAICGWSTTIISVIVYAARPDHKNYTHTHTNIFIRAITFLYYLTVWLFCVGCLL
jgi:hypothetical protein